MSIAPVPYRKALAVVVGLGLLTLNPDFVFGVQKDLFEDQTSNVLLAIDLNREKEPEAGILLADRTLAPAAELSLVLPFQVAPGNATSRDILSQIGSYNDFAYITVNRSLMTKNISYLINFEPIFSPAFSIISDPERLSGGLYLITSGLERVLLVRLKPTEQKSDVPLAKAIEASTAEIEAVAVRFPPETQHIELEGEEGQTSVPDALRVKGDIRFYPGSPGHDMLRVAYTVPVADTQKELQTNIFKFLGMLVPLALVVFNKREELHTRRAYVLLGLVGLVYVGAFGYLIWDAHRRGTGFEEVLINLAFLVGGIFVAGIAFWAKRRSKDATEGAHA